MVEQVYIDWSIVSLLRIHISLQKELPDDRELFFVVTRQYLVCRKETSMPSTSQQPRTIQTDETRSLDIRSLILLAVLLAAGFILNFTLGRAIASLSGGAIGPEFNRAPQPYSGGYYRPGFGSRDSDHGQLPPH